MKLWLATLGGAGLSPVGPGTVGSLVTSVLLLAIFLVGEEWSYWTWQGVLGAGIVVSGALTVWLGEWVKGHWGRRIPGAFVLDEVAGICLTMLFVPMWGGWWEGVVLGVGFVGFRVFDIVKVWPCKKLEGLPGGWGVLADDLMAGVYANVLCQVVFRVIVEKSTG